MNLLIRIATIAVLPVIALTAFLYFNRAELFQEYQSRQQISQEFHQEVLNTEVR